MRGINILALTLAATADLTAKRFVGFDGAPAAANDNTLGIGRMDVASGEDQTVDVLGTTDVEAGAAVAVGDPVSSDADGKAVKTDGTTLTVSVGRALTAATAAGQSIQVLLIPN